MRIVTRKEFLALPENTVYAASSPGGSFGEPLVKMESLETDWYYDNLFHFDDHDDSNEFNEKIDQMIHEGKEFPLKLDTMDRDGMFDDDQLYVIYDAEDIKKIIARLQMCLFNISKPAIMETDFVALEDVAKKNGVTTRQAYDITQDVLKISRMDGYKGDPHSQTE